MGVAIRKLKSRFRFSRKVRRGRNGRRRISPILIFVLIFALVFAMFTIFETRLKPAALAIAETRARNLAVREINLAVVEKLAFENGGIAYQDIVEIDKSADGSIEAIRTNIQLVNLLQSQLMLLINDRIWEIAAQDISIPAGNLSSFQLFAGRGPNIPIRLVPVGDAEVEMLHNFTAAGINQTRHQILLEITANIQILMPTGNSQITVTTQVPIAETIIVGSVPQTYMSLEGFPGLVGGIGGVN